MPALPPRLAIAFIALALAAHLFHREALSAAIAMIIVLLTASSKFATPKGTNSVEAQIRYDATAHLIVAMHSTTTNNIAASGITSVVITQVDRKQS